MKNSIYFSDKLQYKIIPEYVKSFYSEKVKRNCYSFLSSICDYCKNDYLNINTLQAQSYFNYLSLPQQPGKKSLARSTIQLKYSSYHAFSNYLIRNASTYGIEYIYNPFDKVNIHRTDQPLNPSKIPSISQMNDILHQCENEPVLYTALSLIIRCGFSVGELTKLRQDSFILDDSDHAAVVFSYRNSQRYVKIPDDILEILDYYWKNQISNTEYLFENKAGHPMSVRDLERLYKKRMGENFQFTLSDLRNGCIALLYTSGAPIKEIGKYLGIRQYHWLHRYDKVIPELSLAACDYSNLFIKPPTYAKSTEK